jgi:CubicO group peptidase (beta-lactamase class C family)
MPAIDTELLPETRRALHHRLATAQVEGRAPSVVAAVVRDGRAVWTQAWGTVDGAVPDGDVQYRIGSITKTFVTVLVLRLRDRGRLALTDPLADHLPGTAVDDLTVGDLLAHTAGLTSEPPGPWWERTPGTLRPELADVLGSDPLAHRPGERFHYSNPGFALLGALVERLHGKPWDEVLRREVLEPLKMTRTTLLPVAPSATGWGVHPWADVLHAEPPADLGRMAPAGQLWSTATDLARFAAFLLAGDKDVLAADTLTEMRTPTSATETMGADLGYGLGMQLLSHDGRELAGHTGSVPGFLATLWTSPADGLATVVLGNATTGLRVATVAAELLKIVADREPRFPEPWRPLPTIDPLLLELAGPWYWGPQPYALRPLPDGHLDLGTLAGSGQGTHLRPTGPETWQATNGYHNGEKLHLKRNAEGRITHLDLGTFVYTRTPYDPTAPIPGGTPPPGWHAAH